MRLAMTAVLLASVVAVAAPPEPPRLVSPEQHTSLTSLIPKSDDKVLDQIKADPRLLWYDHAAMPAVHQDWKVADEGIGFVYGVMSTKVNISADKTEPHGNPNREFPWLATAGIDESTPVARFVVLPEAAAMRWGTDTNGRRTWDVLTWTYPVGTVFGEVITVTDTDGWSFPCEVRLRRKGAAGWTATAYRPFPTARDLQVALPGLPATDRQILSNALAIPKTRVVTTKNHHPDKTVIDETATWEWLPAVSAATVKSLLNRPFKNALGQEWRTANPPTHAPTTDADFHIVPKGYAAGGVAVTSKSCARCHDSVAAHADVFDRKRDWYGHVRGSDTIFSFHPFDPKVSRVRSFSDKADMLRNSTLFRWAK